MNALNEITFYFSGKDATSMLTDAFLEYRFSEDHHRYLFEKLSKFLGEKYHRYFDN